MAEWGKMRKAQIPKLPGGGRAERIPKKIGFTNQ